jgi:GAF domain-containing protein
MRPPVETASGLSAVLRSVVAVMQHVSGADIVSIFLYDESTRTYYAPFAIGQQWQSACLLSSSCVEPWEISRKRLNQRNPL